MTTKAQLETQLTEVQAQLAETQDQLAAAQAPSQPAELTKIEKRKQCASNTTVVLVRRCFPVTKKDGTPVEGGFKLPATQSMDVNYGDTDNPDYQKVTVQETWFEVWNNGTPLGDQLNTLIQSTEYAVLRLYWEFSSKPENVYVTDEVNDKGVSYKKTNFRYAPAKRIFAFDTLAQVDLESGNQEEIPF
ncbi:MAG: hypothetical protein CBD74_09400 [Saprospirales bacterium TMED214]|nr:MAG: hypothetical protein CBD74_09400 [Saprospirales bacterium TMED214]